MIDEKDIEIAKLRGQVEALEKLVKQLIVAPAPQFVPMPYPLPQIQPTPSPWVDPYPYQPINPFWYVTSTSTYGQFRLSEPLYVAHNGPLS